jgi:nitrogenase-stabilizing/protective protein
MIASVAHTVTDELELDDLESAEDFLDFFEVAYDAAVVQVNRLHILQRFHDYLARQKVESGPTREQYRFWLTKAYDDFVRSDAITERVFRVHKRAAGIATVPLSAIGRRARIKP